MSRTDIRKMERITLEDGCRHSFNTIGTYRGNYGNGYYVITDDDKIIFLPTRCNSKIKKNFDVSDMYVGDRKFIKGVVKVDGYKDYNKGNEDIKYLNILVMPAFNPDEAD